jgi:glycosyltransferase involved in cell wall biosynthesis
MSDQQNMEPINPRLTPTYLWDVELAEPLTGLPRVKRASGESYQRGMALARLHDEPLGNVEFTFGKYGLPAGELAEGIWSGLGDLINRHLEKDGLPRIDRLTAEGLAASEKPACVQKREDFMRRAPLASVIVATHNRPAGLRLCLETLLGMEYPSFEIVVVDNAPSDRQVPELLEHEFKGYENIHCIREDIPGLAVAHNRGLEIARGEIIAFTDDDVTPDRLWLLKLAQAFETGSHVGCVTGLILPAELESYAQLLSEVYWGYGKGYERRIYDLKENRPASPLFPYTAGRFGSGSNMAYRRAALAEMGGFDPATGVGTPTQGGDDLSGFFDVIACGWQLVYEPAAAIRHYHRADPHSLSTQAYGYGLGLGAYLTKTLLDRPARILEISRKALKGIAYASQLHAERDAQDASGAQMGLAALERKGLFLGPYAYVKSKWKYRKVKANLEGLKNT